MQSMLVFIKAYLHDVRRKVVAGQNILKEDILQELKSVSFQSKRLTVQSQSSMGPSGSYSPNGQSFGLLPIGKSFSADRTDRTSAFFHSREGSCILEHNGECTLPTDAVEACTERSESVVINSQSSAEFQRHG